MPQRTLERYVLLRPPEMPQGWRHSSLASYDPFSAAVVVAVVAGCAHFSFWLSRALLLAVLV